MTHYDVIEALSDLPPQDGITVRVMEDCTLKFSKASDVPLSPQEAKALERMARWYASESGARVAILMRAPEAE